MTDSACAITVGYFGAPEERQALRRSFLRIGYQPSFLANLAGFGVGNDDEWRNRFVLFYSDSNVSPDRMQKVLDECSVHPSITILRPDHAKLAEPILQRSLDFLFWPCSDQELALRLERGHMAAEHSFVAEAAQAGDAIPQLPEFSRYGLVGHSSSFRAVLQLILKIAPCDAPVLIEGETGTGKELCARAVHYLGARYGQPFVPVNCGALPDSLMENELFGHEKGAFTDAKGSQAGLIAQAQGGTLFLDEIETLSSKGQVTLLRFLEDYEYRTLGGKNLCKADVRLIAASNTELTGMVERGEFRRDLFYRLNVLSLHLPPLRERAEDIRWLAEEFIKRASRRYRQPLKVLHPDTIVWMQNHTWPGNVRELQNFIHRAFITAEGAFLEIDAEAGGVASDSGDGGNASVQAFGSAKLRAINKFEQDYLSSIMREVRGNVTMAARLAGKERRAFGKLLKKHGFDRSQFTF